MKTVVRRLVAKELFVHRGSIAGGAVAGVASVVVAATGGQIGFNVGVLTWITTVVAVGALMAFYGVVGERKEHVLPFVLSLPLSPADYVKAKLLGLGLCFLLPWTASSAAAVALVALHPGVPDGLLPYTAMLCLFLLANFAVVLCGALHARSEGLMTATIVVTNMSVTLFMFTVVAVPGIGNHLTGEVPVWNGAVFAVLAIEAAILAIAVTLPLLWAARRPDFL